MTNAKEVIQQLKEIANEKTMAEHARVGIVGKKLIGVNIWALRKVAKELGRDHKLAIELWDTDYHEARILASYVAEPLKVNGELCEKWVLDFDSWDICDQVVDLFERAGFGWVFADEWTRREEEFVKRAGFAIIAGLAVHDKEATDERFIELFKLIEAQAWDERKYVKKAVNWALRNIGKRNKRLNSEAIAAAERIKEQDTKPARWIASNALRELKSEKVQARLK